MPNPTVRLFPVAPSQRVAAQSWFERPDRTPRKPRLASSVVLLRDSPRGTETYLSYRRGESPLGKVAFPGGSIEENDDATVAWYGPAPAVWAKTMGADDARLARRHVVAAIRELFEETGILLAGPDESSLLEGNRGPEWMAARTAVATQDASFLELLGRRGLGLRTDLLRPLSNWHSADFALRRFDTRYFAAVQPTGQDATLLEGKGVWADWKPAAEVIAARDTTALGDEIGQPDTTGLTLGELVVPAVELTLEKVASARGCIAYLSSRRPAAVYRPELVEVDGEPCVAVRPASGAEGSSQHGR
ncbi:MULTISPECIES: NUDIX hydrolase [unclassified Arthrobacter]|uniref:NUDIX hydrolase n=1 Tax=unclassified Arthrobacter TaxID=235627 RepID=UPI001E3B5F99|nr:MULTISPECIES: NUDIX hydrolase [unclassified Arthrobacter]MCC9144700.1 NUDIX hydrolase [Arthrobacter sp. zg-Y919]MDK1275926.1 NUDIX hydrolase [Arthrobacter sp. zg.Y919]WIB02720.1 NUDIX hydrolase [Arthrobacter sp. zg-Y919]